MGTVLITSDPSSVDVLIMLQVATLFLLLVGAKPWQLQTRSTARAAGVTSDRMVYNCRIDCVGRAGISTMSTTSTTSYWVCESVSLPNPSAKAVSVILARIKMEKCGDGGKKVYTIISYINQLHADKLICMHTLASMHPTLEVLVYDA